MKRKGVIVFDLDGTFWQKEVKQGKRTITQGIPPKISILIELLELKFAVSVCSGNAAEHVIRVLIHPLLKAMWERGNLVLASDFYAFFQLGGGLARFKRKKLEEIQNAKTWAAAEKKLFRLNGREFHPEHIDGSYVELHSIDMKEHGKLLTKIFSEANAKYLDLLEANQKDYRIFSGEEGDEFKNPKPHRRAIKLKGSGPGKVVQYTLKPLYSERHYTKSANSRLGFKDSIRYQIAQFVNEQLEKEGIQLTATAAGGTSIDITNQNLSKTMAITQLQNMLIEKKGNMLYFGDEFHLGGNDVVVPLDGKVTSFSVGEKAIFHPSVFAAPEAGPRGTFAILHLLIGFASSHRGSNSAVDAFCKEHSRRIVIEKLGSLSAETLQAMALLATAEARETNLGDLNQLIANQVRAGQMDQRPPGASHWTEAL